MTMERLFNLMFEDRNISCGELVDFAEDHLAKLGVENTKGVQAGLYGELIAGLGPKLEAFRTSLSAEDSEQSRQEGLTVAKDQALASFKALVRRREVRIASELGRPGAAYEEFFPRGLNEYGRATMGNAQTLMDRMVKAATKYEEALGGPELKDEFTAVRDAFVGARAAQVGQIGRVSVAAAMRRDARGALAVQLQLGVLIIAAHNIGQPERIPVFFSPFKLKDPRRKKKKAAAAAGG